MIAGLNLYSLRQHIADKDAFYDTCVKLKDMGYSYLQCSGMSIGVEDIKAVCDSVGLSVKLTHSPLKRILEDTDNLVREHDLLDCEYIGLGWVDMANVSTAQDAQRVADDLENTARLLKSKGKKFVYHNHAFEFAKYDGKAFYDMLIENTRELGFVFDTYWVQAGGASVLEYVDKAKGRIDCVHLKDYKMAGNTPRFAALGDGNINFVEVIAAMQRAGAKYFFVEQDDAGAYDEPFSEVKKSIDFLKQIKL